MNLRKDHSHWFNFDYVNFGCEGCLRWDICLQNSRATDAHSPTLVLAGASVALWPWVRIQRAGEWKLSCFSENCLGRALFQLPQLSAMDILARAPVKGAAKRDSLCELQNSVNQWPPERALHSWDFLRVCLLQRLTCPNFASTLLPCVLMSYCPLWANGLLIAWFLQNALRAVIQVSTFVVLLEWRCSCLQPLGCRCMPLAWSQTSEPAEFKHISKRRKRN